MKQKEPLNRTRKITVRLYEAEYRNIHARFCKTTKQKLSDYIRCVLLQKPLTAYTRNRSLDDFVAELVVLRRELNAVGHNLNQAVKKLNSLDHFREVQTWALVYEKSRQALQQKVDAIEEKMGKISEIWLQK